MEGLIGKISGTLTNPSQTMKGIAEHPMIEEGVVIVAIYAIISAISVLLLVGMAAMPAVAQNVDLGYALAYFGFTSGAMTVWQLANWMVLRGFTYTVAGAIAWILLVG